MSSMGCGRSPPAIIAAKRATARFPTVCCKPRSACEPCANGGASATRGFGADYTHEASEPAYVGVVYAPPSGSGPPGKSGPPAAARARVVSIAFRHGRFTITLACPAGGGACATSTVTVAVTEHLRNGRLTAVSAKARPKTHTKVVTIASAAAALAAGQTQTLTSPLNGNGAGLLKRYGRLTALATLHEYGIVISTTTTHLVRTAATKKK